MDTDQYQPLSILKNYWMTIDVKKHDKSSSEDFVKDKISSILNSGRPLTEQQLQNLKIMSGNYGEDPVTPKPSELEILLCDLEATVKSYRENFHQARKWVMSSDTQKVMSHISQIYPQEQADEIKWRLYEAVTSSGEFCNEFNVRWILTRKHDIAQRMDHPSIAEYRFSVQPTIMQTPDNAQAFVENVIKSTYPILMEQIQILKDTYPEFKKTSIANLNHYFSRYSKQYDGETPVSHSYVVVLHKIFDLMKEMFGITFVRSETNELGPEYEVWNCYYDGNFKGPLYLDMFRRTGDSNQPTDKAHKKEDDIDGYLIRCDFTGGYLNSNDIRVLLQKFGNFLFGIFNETGWEHLPIEFRRIPSLFLEKFYPKLELSGPTIRKDWVFGTMVEAMKALLDLDVHSIKDESLYYNLKKLENKTFEHIYQDLIHDELFPEFLDPHILSLTNMYSVFGLGQDAISYRSLLSEKAAQILFNGLQGDTYTTKDIIELWRRPEPGNALYDFITPPQTYLNPINL